MPGTEPKTQGRLHPGVDIGGSPMTRAQVLRAAAGVVVTASGMSALSACSGDSTESGTSTAKSKGRGGVVQFALGSGTLKDNLDPAIASGEGNNTVIALTNESLLVLDGDTWKPEARLAKSWETNQDASQWTFLLQEGVEWHDGTPFTASDVAYTLKRHLDKKVGSALQGSFEPYLSPDGIEVVDPHTIRLNLKKPNAFLYLAVGITRSQIIQEGTTDFATLIGTGPFRVKSYKPGGSFELDRNPGYWQEGKPYIDGIRAVNIPEVSGQSRSVLAGDSQIAPEVDSTAVREAEGHSEVQVVFKKSEQNLPIVLDQTQKPFDDERVRMALKLAVDRQKMVDTVFAGLGEVGSDFPVPPSDGFYPEGVAPRAQDVDEARRLLSEAGYASGIELTLLTSESAVGMANQAVVFAESVKDAGITVNVKQAPADTYWDQVWLTKPMYVSNWNRRHAWQGLSELFRTDAPWNESRLKLPEVDDLLDEAARTPDLAGQKELIGTALQLVDDNAGWVCPGWVHQAFLMDAKLSGFKIRPVARIDLTEASVTA